jgi:hypothetical protein
MRRRLAAAILVLTATGACRAAPHVDLELVTERGVQITAPQQWLQLLAGIGIENVRIRGAKPGDVPKVSNLGTEQRPSFEVVGVITARDQLQLPGGTFSRADRGRIKDYFERLAADGAEALTAARGMFGLTEKEIESVFADLAQPVEFETKGRSLGAVVDQLQSIFKLKLAIDTRADSTIREARPVADELNGVSAGTGLSLMLRANGLVMRPEKSRGNPVVYRVATDDPSGGARPPAAATTGEPPVATRIAERAGKADDDEIKQWPVGWEPRDTPGRIAPSLFELLNAEIDGFTLTETLAAIGPRLKIPMYVDHTALAAHKIDPSKVQVRLAKTRTSYKRVIDRAVAHARLHSQVRVDEAGNAFLWISR